MESSSSIDKSRTKVIYQDQDKMDEQLVGGGGDQYDSEGEEEEENNGQIRQPFSPIYRTGNAMKLARCLYRLGVAETIVQRCSGVSLQIFLHFEREDLAEMTQGIPMGLAILRAAQGSLREELKMEEEEKPAKKQRQERKERDIDDEEEDNGQGQEQPNRDRGSNESTRRTIGMRPMKEYADPYALSVKNEEGTDDMLFLYGKHNSDGTPRAMRMPSLMTEEQTQKGFVHLKIPQKNLCLVTSSREDLVRRAAEILPILIATDPSRWFDMFGGDWKMHPSNFKAAALRLWSMDIHDRNTWVWRKDITSFTMISKCQILKDEKKMVMLYTGRWSLVLNDGLTIADFDESKDESRSSDKTVCKTHNRGLASAIMRVQDLMTSLMAGQYEGIFRNIVDFFTRDESVLLVAGDQAAHNFNKAMIRVSVPLAKGADLIMPNGMRITLDGPADVADAIRMSMKFQIEFMRDPHQMRTQLESFRERIIVMQSRSEGIEEKKEGKGGNQEEKEKDRRDSRNKGEKEGGKIDKRNGTQEEIVPYKSGFLCMKHTGGTLGVKEPNGKLMQCTRGTKCLFVHKAATKITLQEAKDAVSKTRESDSKADILKAIEAFKKFKK
jgi:hypothetical protein